MAYRVEIARHAEVELEELYLWVTARAPQQGARWFNGLEQAVLSLDKRIDTRPRVVDITAPSRAHSWAQSRSSNNQRRQGPRGRNRRGSAISARNCAQDYPTPTTRNGRNRWGFGGCAALKSRGLDMRKMPNRQTLLSVTLTIRGEVAERLKAAVC